jgi:hypothetical protein
MAAVVSFFNPTVDRTRSEAANILEAFIENRGGRRDWDNFISVAISNPELEAIRRRCSGLSSEFPPDRPNYYCGPGGLEVMRILVAQLRE